MGSIVARKTNYPNRLLAVFLRPSSQMSEDYHKLGYDHLHQGRDSTVGIETRYGLDSPGIEFRWGRDFVHPSRPNLGGHPASYTIRTGSFPGVKQPGRGVDHPHPSSAEVKEKVGLHVYSPFGLS
jgi:hypothetical protein